MTLRRGFLIIAGGAAVVIGTVAVVVVLLVAGVVHLSDFGIGAPQLPHYGRPRNAHQLDEDSLACSSAVAADWCRTLMFGGNSDFEITRQELATTYDEHHWQVTPASESARGRLEVTSPSQSMCISYENIKASSRPLPGNLPKDWYQYEALIYVWVLPCPAPPY